MRLTHRPSRPDRFRPLRGPKRGARERFLKLGRPARRLDAGGQARVESYRRMACLMAWRFAQLHANDVPVEELLAEALCGLTYASSLYEEDRRVPFGAYATLVIRHYLTHAIRRWRRDTRFRPLSGPTLAGDEEVEVEAAGIPPDAAGGAVARDLCERIREVLPDQLYQVLYLYHGEGHTLKEIGAQVGLSRQRVRQLIAKATDRVRQRLPEEMG